MTQQPSPAVAVFCASRSHPAFVPWAEELGREIARRGAGLVYGGGGAGLMGAVSKGAHESGAVTGVVPQGMFGNEQTAEPRGELFMVRGMHARKELMYRLSVTGFLALPGGIGTMGELTEAAEWSQLGLHHARARRRVVLLNWPIGPRRRFWDPLIQQLDDARDHGFLPPEDRDLIQDAGSAGEALDLLGLTSERPGLTVHPGTPRSEREQQPPGSSAPTTGSAA